VRRILVRDLLAGLILARPIYNERGDVLLNSGVEINDRFIGLLRTRGVASVMVREPGEEDVEPEDIVSERVRVAALSNVHKIYEVAAKATADLQGKTAPQIASALQQSNHKPSATDAALYEQLFHSVEGIVDEVLNADTLPGLNTLKSFDNYTFCHSVDVAVTALLLGKKLFLSRDQLKALGAGCILHDIGKTFIDHGVLTKPGKLSEAEYALICTHPQLGYDFLRANMPGDQVLPKHVALQHHEHQNGGGYPRGLRGTNKVAREQRDRSDPNRIMLLGEIAAVADVYDALASDRPYRAGLPAEKIVGIMQDMRGRHLNTEVLDAFFDVFPRYPAGVDLVVTAGRYQGFRGVVLATNRRAVDRPRIRLTRDGRGVRLSVPLELDLTREPETAITCVVEEVPVSA
jgi:HD-GYP domain-containing protein (c-di-GMP phosphodiesterase class II)